MYIVKGTMSQAGYDTKYHQWESDERGDEQPYVERQKISSKEHYNKNDINIMFKPKSKVRDLIRPFEHLWACMKYLAVQALSV